MNFKFMLVFYLLTYCSSLKIESNSDDLNSLIDPNSFQHYLFKIMNLKRTLEAAEKKRKDRRKLKLKAFLLCNQGFFLPWSSVQCKRYE